MQLKDMTLGGFGEVLASSAPAPGGGSTAALEGALGAALIGMVASLTVGRAKYADSEQLMREGVQRAGELRQRLLDTVDSDAEAFNAVSAVFSMPKATEEEKASRKLAMQSALKVCTLSPLGMMECALEALELAERLYGKTNESAASDFGVAVLSLKACVQGAWLNVLINLGGIDDKAFAAKYREQGEGIIKKALHLADQLYAGVLESL